MKKKNLMFLILLIIFFVESTTIINATTNEKTNENNHSYLERNLKQVELSTKIQNIIKDYYNIKDVYQDIFPAYYGGIYISDDAKNLIIQIVKDNIPEKNSSDYLIYHNIISMDKSIMIEYVNNSFNELNYINNSIADYMKNNATEARNVMGGYIDVMNNSVVVELQKNNAAKQNELMKIFDTSIVKKFNGENNKKIIRFIKSKNMISFTNLNAGMQMPRDLTCSIGFRTSYNGTVGHTTAGHCVLYGYPGAIVTTGEIILKQFENYQRYDYAFIATGNTEYQPTNKLAYTSSGITELAVVSYCPSVTVNMAIAKSGMKTHYTTGKVTALNQSVHYNNTNVTVYGLVKSNVNGGEGDSGGPVFIPRTDANGGAIPIGIVSGGSSGFLGIGREMYFTNIEDLPEGLVIGRY